MRIGVLSDTHNHLSPKIFDVFAGVDQIMHAGDIVSMDIIIELSAIAPVIAVCGNMDSPEIAARYPQDQRVVLAGVDIFMTHNGGMLLRSPKLFEARCGPKRPDVFIWGHTHRVENRWIDTMLSLNPGSARAMLGLSASVALLELHPHKMPQAEIIRL
ncbi:MAG: metallophosphoesterase [Candidatus Abyssobacteria bacterium SURF_5]|uniref:Phosphoesterase n=1 Tax=Abyssobacteria bacterium (strain SURF_5) TaxID=2093360 RepID=A0A3A4NSQ3_ABYX5|nr:MAG: metallophosphoesterase [Candidatus Abyssubacteria bacterium SURF_5]